MRMLNLTIYDTTPEQYDLGVVSLGEEEQKDLIQLLTFDDLTTNKEIKDRAARVASFADNHGCESALISGPPYLIKALRKRLKKLGITPFYAFATRVLDKDGVWTGEWRHKGFIEA